MDAISYFCGKNWMKCALVNSPANLPGSRTAVCELIAGGIDIIENNKGSGRDYMVSGHFALYLLL